MHESYFGLNGRAFAWPFAHDRRQESYYYWLVPVPSFRTRDKDCRPPEIPRDSECPRHNETRTDRRLAGQTNDPSGYDYSFVLGTGSTRERLTTARMMAEW